MDPSLRLITPLQRRLFLRGVPGFNSLDDEDLHLIADNMQPRFFAEGATLCQSGKPVEALFGVIEGLVRIERNGKFFRRVRPGEPGVGAMAMFAQDQLGISAFAERDTVALELAAEDIFQIFEIRSTVLRFVIQRIAVEINRRRKQLGYHLAFSGTMETSIDLPTHELDIVQRVQLLRQMFALATFRVSIAFELARHTPAVSLLPEVELWRTGTTADHFYLILDGVVDCLEPERTSPFVLGPRDSVGLPDVLSRGAYSYDARVGRRTTALRVPAAAFEQIIHDNHEFAMSVLAVSARQVLDLYDKIAGLGPGDDAGPNEQSDSDDGSDEWMRALSRAQGT